MTAQVKNCTVFASATLFCVFYDIFYFYFLLHTSIFFIVAVSYFHEFQSVFSHCPDSSGRMEVAAYEELGGPKVNRIIEDTRHGVTIYISEPHVQNFFPGLKVPFDLSIKHFSLVHGFLLRHPTNIQAANIMP